MKWGKVSDIFESLKFKGKCNKAVVSSVMLYALTWLCMCGVTREDRIRNYFIIGSVGVAPIVDKIMKNWLR